MERMSQHNRLHAIYVTPPIVCNCAAEQTGGYMKQKSHSTNKATMETV